MKKEKLEKHGTTKRNNLKSNNGITLIALVVTIVVLLILAGISINAVLGNNGLITRARDAKVEQAHAQVRDAMSLLYGSYQVEVLTAKEDGVQEVVKLASLQLAATDTTTETFLEYLYRNSIVDSNGVVSTENLLGSTISLGNGTGTSDVYKVEEVNGVYQLNYYDEDGNLSCLLDTYGNTTGSEMGEVTVKTEYFTYTYDETTQTATITGISEEYGEFYEYYNASTYETEYRPLYIKDGETKITDIVIPSEVEINGIVYTVTSIGNDAFEGYSNMSEFTSFVIPDTVTTIGSYAFYECSSLITINYTGTEEQWKSISIGNGNDLLTAPKKIYNYASSGEIDTKYFTFEYDEATQTATITGIDEQYGEFYEYYNDSTYETEYRPLYIKDGETKITDIVIPSEVEVNGIIYTVTSIGNDVFKGYSDMSEFTSFVIPDTVTTIGSYAFYKCTSLITINYTGTEEQWKSISIGSGNDLLTAPKKIYNYSK